MNEVGLPARAYNLGAGSLPNGATTIIDLDTVDPDDDPGGYFDLVNNRYVCPNPGVYRVLWVVTAVAAATGNWAISGIFRSNLAECVGSLAWGAAALALMPSAGGIDVTCKQNDYLTLVCSVSGSSVNVEPGKQYTTISVQQVG